MILYRKDINRQAQTDSVCLKDINRQTQTDSEDNMQNHSMKEVLEILNINRSTFYKYYKKYENQLKNKRIKEKLGYSYTDNFIKTFIIYYSRRCFA